MQKESIEKHLEDIQRKRGDLFIRSLDFINNYYNNSRNYYLVMLFVALVIVLTGISLFFSFESNDFVVMSLLVSIFSFLFSLVNYLNSLEKSSEKIGDIFKNLDFKYKQEIDILRNFYAGRISEQDIRSFYLKGEIGVDKKYFINQTEIVLRWINFISLSVAVILIFFNFF